MYEQVQQSEAATKQAQVDEEERLDKLRATELQDREEERRRMSSVMRKGLPRPTVIRVDMFADEEASRVAQMIQTEMLKLMVHDNATYPLKGMKASRLPVLSEPKTQYSSAQLDHARQLIEEEARAMGAIRENEAWPEHLDADMIWIRETKELRTMSDHPNDLVVANLKHKFQARAKQLEKEAKRCDKYGNAIEVMFKKYVEMGATSGDMLVEMARARADKVIEKDVFTTLLALESKNMQTRQQALQSELKTELERERILQAKFQVTKVQLERLEKL